MKLAALRTSILLACLLPLAAVAQDRPSLDEMWAIIQKQQAEIDALKDQVAQANQRQQETDSRLVATVESLEDYTSNSVASSGGTALERFSFGGYGELHLNKLDQENRLSSGDDKDEIDLHRFVMFTGYRFSDTLRFFSELEVEHSLAGEGKNGEVEVEQAYIQWDYAQNHRLNAGLFLLPVGILNETHEPDTFYGVERNNVENRIIPSTWWEGGLGLNGEIAPGLTYDFAAHSGLNMDRGIVRNGRQKVSEAKADNFAYTGRIKYTGIPGFEFGLSMQLQDDVLQDETINGASDVSGTLMETHFTYETGPFNLRALYATWDFDSDLNLVRSGADEQYGWYIEPGFRITERLGVFTRFSEWDEQDGDDADSEFQQFDVGLNYYLGDTVVFKLDYQNQDAPDSANEFDGFNFGVGWSY